MYGKAFITAGLLSLATISQANAQNLGPSDNFISAKQTDIFRNFAAIQDTLFLGLVKDIQLYKNKEIQVLLDTTSNIDIHAEFHILQEKVMEHVQGQFTEIFDQIHATKVAKSIFPRLAKIKGLGDTFVISDELVVSPTGIRYIEEPTVWVLDQRNIVYYALEALYMGDNAVILYRETDNPADPERTQDPIIVYCGGKGKMGCDEAQIYHYPRGTLYDFVSALEAIRYYAQRQREVVKDALYGHR